MHAVTKALTVFTVAVACLPGAAHAQMMRVAAGVEDGPTQAASTGIESRGWLDLGVGGGWTRLGDSAPRGRGSFALDFGAGFWLRNQIGIGARLGGWTLEGFNLGDPREGESLSEAFGVFRLRPIGGRPLLLSLEGGWVSYTVNDPATVLREGDGLGARIGAGWDLPVSNSWTVSPVLVGSWGEVKPDVGLERSFSYWSVGALVRVGWSW